jgi:menaquinone-dependent protoporphyrinogen oxidase
MATHLGTPAPLSCDVPVFYATTEGQTRRIAERLASILSASGLDSRAVDMASRDAAVDWSRVRAALVGASLHAGRHQVEACVFVRKHASQLNAIPSAFFSVSLSAASGHPEEVAAAERLAAAFPPGCGWKPATVVSFAGRLAYTQYGFLKRLLMKRIARKEGAPVDTSRDYELTDWASVERLAQHMGGLLSRERGRDRSAVMA